MSFMPLPMIVGYMYWIGGFELLSINLLKSATYIPTPDIKKQPASLKSIQKEN